MITTRIDLIESHVGGFLSERHVLYGSNVQTIEQEQPDVRSDQKTKPQLTLQWLQKKSLFYY